KFPIGKIKPTPTPVNELTEESLPKTEQEKQEAQKLPIRKYLGKLWLAQISRPDIFCALHKCAIWQNKPSIKLFERILHILSYLNGTRDLGMIYTSRRKESSSFLRRKEGNIFDACCDSSFASETRSRYGYFFYCFGNLISWTSTLSTRVLTSST